MNKLIRPLQGGILLTLLVFNPSKTQAALTVTPSKPGNIFYTTETLSIPVRASVGTSVDWVATDYFGIQVGSGTAGVSGGTAILQPATGGRIGYFDLALLEKTGSTVNSTSSTQFAIVTPIDVSVMGSSPYGVMTHFAQFTPTALAPLIARAGIAHIRDEQYWNSVENPKDTFTWPTKFTGYMAAAATNGLKPLMILNWSNRFYDWDTSYVHPEYTAPYTSTGLAGFGNYALQLLNRYGSQVQSVEVWNEYNAGTFIVGQAATNKSYYYALTCQNVWNAIKPTYPGVKVIAGGTVPIAHGFIRDVLNQGANPYIDAFSVHPYRAVPEGVDIEIDGVTNLSKTYNGGVAKPVWATEFSKNINTAAGRYEAPSYTARIVTQMRTAGVEKMYYYLAQDDSYFPYRGLLGKADASRGDYLPNPVYPAYANLIRQLYGYTARGRWSGTLATTTYVYKFQNGSNWRYVCWGGSGDQPAPTIITLSIPTSTATVTDLMGNSQTLTAVAGKIAVQLDLEPVYISVTGGSVTAITEAANGVVADSVAGYSSSQGANGWSYGYVNVSGTYNPASFTQFAWNPWNGDNYRWKPASGTYPFLGIDGMHPYSASWVVRRWQSTVSGVATLSGVITGPASGSDGVNFHVFVDGTEIHTQFIAANALVNYNIPNVALSTGSKVDFVLDRNVSNSNDATGLNARITLTNTLPNPWVTQDIGSVAVTGSATYASGVFTVAGSGADIWGTADAFQYVYQSASGDCSIVARVDSQQNTHAWAKAGVMIRETTVANSRQVMTVVTPSNGVAFQRRGSTGGSTSATTAGGVTAPRWVRIVRAGDTFTSFHSSDGVAWSQIGTPQTIVMGTEVQVGLCVTSHNNAVLSESTFSNVMATP